LIIHIDNHQKDLPIDERSVSGIVGDLCVFLKISCREISIYFTTKKLITELHREFFQDPTPTDCISFPVDDEHLGEIFVCPKVALEYARKKGLDPWRETILYLVHGILHLIGYDDLTAPKKRRMRVMEKKCMTHLSGKKYI